VVAGDFDEESLELELLELSDPDELLDELDFSEEELELELSLELEPSELDDELELEEPLPELFDASRLSLR
jgi:hypothetical protein